MNNNTQYGLIFLSVVSAIVSAYLTANFLYGLGLSMGLPVAMAVVGLCLEAGKVIFSGESVKLHKSGKSKQAFSISIITGLLMLISIAASIAALDSGISASKKQSDSYIALQAQIERFEISINSDLENGYRTRALATESTVSELRNELEALPSSSKFLDQYGDKVSMIVAIALELVSVISVSLCSGYTVTRSNTQQISTSKVDVITPVTTVNTAQGETLTIAARDTEHDIKTAIVAGTVKPSHRGVMSAFSGVSRELINNVLKDLSNGGVLKPYRNGYCLA